MRAAAREVILNPVGDVCLQGFYSAQPNESAKGVVMLLHGWEGSVDSTYMLHTGRVIFEHGYSVFRLNFRDHGDTHHLNSGLFYAVLLDEVFGAVQEVVHYAPKLPLNLVGFSMGGNFALRIARGCLDHPIPNLNRVISISPALDPEKSTLAIDAYPLLRRYFHRKWSRSLLKKQTLHPDLYNFNETLKLRTIMGMTEDLIKHYSAYANASDYFRGYTITGEALARLTVPVSIVTAQDDPIIPVENFYDLKLSSTTELIIHPHGGHNGFLQSLMGMAWYEKKLIEDWLAES